MRNSRQSNQARGASDSCAGGGNDAPLIRASRSGWLVVRLLLALLVCNLLLLSDFAGAQDADRSAGEAAVAGSDNQDLLLFWEEKELYVETATRTAKPISQVAENMVVVTAKDILDMNAHNVAEVLRYVPGVFVDMDVSGFNSASHIYIQGSSETHVTVLVDGVLWNMLGGGNADVGSIPVRIIERIEIIKGPASSSWGSALGGVINIITKKSGDSARPKGMASASYGQKNSRDFDAEAYGKGGPVGYYLYAGRQESEINNKEYQRNSFYGKMNVSPTHQLDLQATLGYSNPKFDNGVVVLSPLTVDAKANFNVFIATGSADYRVSPELSFKGTGFIFNQRSEAPSFLLPSYAIRKYFLFDDHTVGGDLKIVYAGDVQTAVLGADISYGALDQTSIKGAAPPKVTDPTMNKWALFANDTVVLEKFAITPGIRFDHNNLSGSFVSPSLGATYELGEHAIARASAARGFTSPPLSMLTGGGIGAVANPALTAEYGWSYQAGVESVVMDYLNLKGNVFRHDIRNVITLNSTQFTNQGSLVRQGYELEAECAPIYNVSLKSAHAFVHIEADSPPATDNYSYQVVLKYDDRQSLLAQLAGTYVWWNLPASAGAKYDDFIWDLALTKKFHTSGTTTVDVFFSVHNLFNGSQYTLNIYPNPGRWAEGGVRFSF